MKLQQCTKTKNGKSAIDTVIARNWSRANKTPDALLACMPASSFEAA